MKTLAFICISIFFGAPSLVASFEVSITSAAQKVSVGEVLEIVIMVDPEGETINALEGTLVLPKQFTVEAIEDAGIVTLWIEKPRVQENTILFSGIIPTGFSGALSHEWSGYQGAVFLKVYLRAIMEGEGVLFLDPKTRFLLHDGKGTAIAYSSNPVSIRVSGISETTRYTPIDDEPPEIVSAEIVRDETVANGEWMLATVVQDTSSVILELSEKKSYFIPSVLGSWRTIDSLVRLEDQNRTSVLVVRATDSSGNTSEYYIPRVRASALDVLFIGIFAIGILVGMVALRRIRITRV